jgi:hypothetical protein
VAQFRKRSDPIFSNITRLPDLQQAIATDASKQKDLDDQISGFKDAVDKLPDSDQKNQIKDRLSEIQDDESKVTDMEKEALDKYKDDGSGLKK